MHDACRAVVHTMISMTGIAVCMRYIPIGSNAAHAECALQLIACLPLRDQSSELMMTQHPQPTHSTYSTCLCFTGVGLLVTLPRGSVAQPAPQYIPPPSIFRASISAQTVSIPGEIFLILQRTSIRRSAPRLHIIAEDVLFTGSEPAFMCTLINPEPPGYSCKP